MNKERSTHRCPGCFEEEVSSDGEPCRTCGWSGGQGRPPLALPVQTELKGRYTAGRVLGEPGGFGVTYLGYDRLEGQKVAIKEYFPREVAGRDTDGRSVVAHSGEGSEEFRYGKEQFLGEAQTLARFDHANIVSVRDFFEENGTAYLVMEYYEGKTLEAYLGERPDGRMEPEAATEVMLRVLDGLKAVHEEGYLHRDVKPENVYLTKEGRPILIDFGAARQAVGERSQSLSVVMTPGYAPYEQYSRKGNQGPHTDVYGCGATLYRMVTGEKPPAATDRVIEDTLREPREVNPEVPEGLSRAIVGALRMGDQERLPDAKVLQQRLRDGEAQEAPSSSVGQSPEPSLNFETEPGVDRVELSRVLNEDDRSNHKINSLSFSPNGRVIATGHQKGQVRLFSVDRGLEDTLRGHEAQVNEVAFSPDGELVASGSTDGTVRVWSAKEEGASYRDVRTITPYDGGFFTSISVTSVAFTPDGEMLVIGIRGGGTTGGGRAELWSIEDGEKIGTKVGYRSTVAFSPKGELVAMGSKNGGVEIWRIKDEETVYIIDKNGHIKSVEFSLDGKFLAVGGTSGVGLWSSQSGDKIWKKHGPTDSVDFSPNSKLLATGGAGGLRIWSARSGDGVWEEEERVTSVSFSPDGKCLASGRDSEVKLWNVVGDISDISYVIKEVNIKDKLEGSNNEKFDQSVKSGKDSPFAKGAKFSFGCLITLVLTILFIFAILSSIAPK